MHRARGGWNYRRRGALEPLSVLFVILAVGLCLTLLRAFPMLAAFLALTAVIAGLLWVARRFGFDENLFIWGSVIAFCLLLALARLWLYHYDNRRK